MALLRISLGMPSRSPTVRRPAYPGPSRRIAASARDGLEAFNLKVHTKIGQPDVSSHYQTPAAKFFCNLFPMSIDVDSAGDRLDHAAGDDTGGPQYGSPCLGHFSY